MRKLLATSLTCLISLVLSSQVDIANAMFDNFEYHAAIKYFKLADTLKDNDREKLAYCYINIKDYGAAEEEFNTLLKTNPKDLTYAYYQALSVKNNGDKEKAKALFNALSALDSTNQFTSLQLSSLDSLIAWDTLESQAVVSNVNAINSTLAEFSPKFYNEGILICTELKYDSIKKRKTLDFYAAYTGLNTKEEKEKLKQEIIESLDYGVNITPRTILVYIPVDEDKLSFQDASPIDKQAFGKPVIVAESKNFNVGTFDIHPESDQLFYTRTPVINKWQPNYEKHSLLYAATIDRSKHKLRSNKLVHIKKISSIYGIGEPSISSDGSTLYFVSDNPKGLGGTDIYKVVKNEKGKWGKPINLGETINTPYDELNPFLYDDNKLYFSSNGRNGFGGHDLYVSKIIDDTLRKAVNLKSPINSQADEFGITIHPINESFGMITSNRDGGAGDDDVYAVHFTNLPPYVKGYVLKEDGAKQKDAIVRLVSAENKEISQLKTSTNGIYRFDLEKNKEYNLQASIIGYAAEKNIETDSNWLGNERQDLNLVPAITIQGYVEDQDGETVPSAKMELFNSEDSLLITIKTDTNGYYQFVANKNKQYLIIGSKGNKSGDLSIHTNDNYSTDSISNMTIFNPNAFVEGIVYGKDSLPIANAIVRLFDSSNVEIARTNSDSNGFYHFDMSSNKKYRIIATTAGMIDDENINTSKDWEGNEKRDLYLYNHPTAQGNTISNNAVFVSDAKIELYAESGERLLTIFSNDTGFYQMALLSDSLNQLKGSSGSLKGEIALINDSSYNTFEKNDILLTNDKDDITYVTGRVLDEKGFPVGGAEIKIYNGNGDLIGTVKSDSSGNYNYQLKKNENYQLIASTQGYEGLENIYTGEKWNPETPTDIVLLPSGFYSEGKVADSKTDEPVEGVTVTLFNNETEKKVITLTDLDGLFKIKLSPNTNYTLKLSMDGYYPKTIELPMGDEIPKKIILDKETLDIEPSPYIVSAIYFDYDKFSITKNSKNQLDLIAKKLLSEKDTVIEINAYADCRGSNQYNLTLSKNRSNAVKRYLINKGVSSNQIKTKSLGATNFVNNCYQADLCSEKEHSLNRRAEFQFFSLTK